MCGCMLRPTDCPEESDELLGQLPAARVQGGVQEERGVVLGHGRRLQVLQNEQVRRGRLQVLHAQAFHEEGAGAPDDGEQVRPESDLSLASAAACYEFGLQYK